MPSPCTRNALIAFEARVAEAFEQKLCKGPVHLSGGNEDQLIEIFKAIHPEDWVFCSYRNHYHALLHGIPEDWLWNEILEGRSMNIHNPEHRFYSSAIVGGQMPIAVGVAAALKRKDCKRKVWCFLGDMAATTGAFHETHTYAYMHELPIGFVIEDNGVSCNTPTKECWGGGFYVNQAKNVRGYTYDRVWPHVGIGKFVQF